jgi:hypothetical protein
MLHIGSKKTVYYVPSHLLPSGWSKTDGEDPILLCDVEMETGHTLVHYLYTGEYQTLDTVVNSTLDACDGLKRAFLVYVMAQNHNLIDLRELALHEFEGHCARLDIFEILGAIKSDFTKLGPDSWVHAFLHAKAKTAFETDHTVFSSEAFLGCLDNVALRDFMLRCVMKLYSDKVSHTSNTEKETSQKLDECDQTRRNCSVEEANTEQCMVVQQDSITSLIDEHDSIMEERCSEEAFESDTMSSEGFCTISCPSYDDSIEPSECLDQSIELLEERTACAVEPIPCEDEIAPCVEEPTPCTEELAPSTDEVQDYPDEAPMEDIAVTETAEEFHIRQEPEMEAKPKNKKTMKQKRLRKMRERREMMESQEIECESSLPKPNETVCASQLAIEKQCPHQTLHILEGDMWKACRPCREYVENVAQQLMDPDLDA